MRSRHFMNADFHRKGHTADRCKNAALNDPESLNVSSQSSVWFVTTYTSKASVNSENYEFARNRSLNAVLGHRKDTTYTNLTIEDVQAHYVWQFAQRILCESQ